MAWYIALGLPVVAKFGPKPLWAKIVCPDKESPDYDGLASSWAIAARMTAVSFP